MLTYTSQYPPIQSGTYVKATSYYNSDYYPYIATDPLILLTGTQQARSWLADFDVAMRFHIDLGSAKFIRRIYYENFHNSGENTDIGVYNFTFWGSNIESDFLDLTYLENGDWVPLTIDNNNEFEEHVFSDEVDPKYLKVINTVAYRYYALKFVDNHGLAGWMGLRRIELQTEDGYPPITEKDSARTGIYSFKTLKI